MRTLIERISIDFFLCRVSTRRVRRNKISIFSKFFHSFRTVNRRKGPSLAPVTWSLSKNSSACLFETSPCPGFAAKLKPANNTRECQHHLVICKALPSDGVSTLSKPLSVPPSLTVFLMTSVHVRVQCPSPGMIGSVQAGAAAKEWSWISRQGMQSKLFHQKCCRF